MSNKKKFPKDKKYKAVIIGAGRIACGFDNRKTKRVLTQAHAFLLHKKVELAGLFDTDKQKVKSASKKWGGKPFFDLDLMLAEIKPEIISVCAPDNLHFSILKKIVKYRPKIVICEKPVTTNVADTEKIISLYKKNKIPILVNYSRRFDVAVQNLKRELSRGKYGKIIAASGVYSKGLLHNGSHLIDLALYLFGELEAAHSLFAISDYDKKDKTIAGFLQFRNCHQFYLLAADQRNYFIFELDIICEKARLRFVNEGYSLVVQTVKSDAFFSGYRILGAPKERATQLDCAMYQMVNNVVDYLDGASSLISPIKNALITQKICFMLSKKYV